MSFLRKFKPNWRDVSSGLVASLLTTFVTAVYAFFYSLIAKVSFINTLGIIGNYKISFWIFPVVVVLVVITLKYKRVPNNSHTFVYQMDTLNVDRIFFNRLRYEYITQEMMMAPRTHYFSYSSFEKRKIDAFLNIEHENQKSDFEFLNPELEALKNEVFEALERTLQTIRSIVCGTAHRDWLGIPAEWSMEEKETASERIQSVENNLCLKYDAFIKQGRRILKI
jgi:hypothetical protein